MRVLVVACFFCAGCAANVPVVLDFPTTRAFDISELVRIDVVAIESDALGSCPDLLASAARGDVLDTIASSEAGVCEALAGLSLPDPGGGPRAFLAEVVDDRNTVILSGCVVSEAYPGAPAIRIELFPTDAYNPSADRLDESDVRAGGACRGGGT